MSFFRNSSKKDIPRNTVLPPTTTTTSSVPPPPTTITTTSSINRSSARLLRRNNNPQGAMGKIIRANHTESPDYDMELVEHSTSIVDLVFVVDNTGSMGTEINIAKDTIQTIITQLHGHFKSDLRFSAISYWDHTDEQAVKECAFTKNVKTAKSYINEMSAQGGGDYPEALASALKVVSEMPFNKKGKKICVWIGDAPPHGMNANGDRYPEGCKDENGNVIDWVSLGGVLKEKGVVCYSIVCERSKNDQQFTLFMDYLATKTDGKCLLLTDASKVPNLIINGCIEDDEMDQLVAEKIKELGEDRVKEMREDELVEQIQKISLNAKVTQVQSFEVVSSNTKRLMECKNLNEIPTDVFVSATNRVEMCGVSSSASSSTFEYASVSRQAPNVMQFKKACSRNRK